MVTPAQAPESPRAVASKRLKRTLLAAIKMALRIESPAVRHNTQTFNRNRYVATAALADYNQLKDRTRAIKEHAIANLPELLATLGESVKRNGGHFFLARDAQEATHYIANICEQAAVRRVVKGKSMTSEEVGLNHELQARGIEVNETDLAEFILQVADEQPSHIIAPAIHYSRERITALFKSRFQTDLPLDTGEELTRFAREHLRQKFLDADAGISGANFIAADSGTIALVESEGNIRLTCLLPPLHIAIAGVEKVLPSRADFAPFLELLAASATGQKLSSYTSIITPPLNAAPVLTNSDPAPRREFHLVLVDNGRMKMRDDPVLHEALYCIRCSACLNSCANFQTVGGHAFGGETYSGGIGGSWEAGTRVLEAARFSELCTGCSRCVNQCPVRIDIPYLNSTLRQRLNRRDAGNVAQLLSTALSEDHEVAPLQKLFFGRYDAFGKWGSLLAPLSNWMTSLPGARTLMERVVGVDSRRDLPPFAKPTLVEAAKNLGTPRLSRLGLPKQSGIEKEPEAKVVLFADIFTNYGSPGRGLATLKIFRAIGMDVIVSEPSPDGRAAISQGMIATAVRQARQTAEMLRRYVENGRDVVIIEPSVLATFRLDNKRLLSDHEGQLLYELLSNNCYDAVEYLWRFIHGTGRDAAKLFPAARHPLGTRVFYHSHCQQKTVGSAPATEALLRAAGFDVATSRVECCGMAGSFGYKKEYYDLSMAVGQDLFQQVAEAEADGARTLVATGTSCHEQLSAGLKRQVYYPTELLEAILHVG